MRYRYDSVDEYISWEQYWEANDLDDISLEEYKMRIYDRTEKAFIKWREREGRAGELKEKHQAEAKTNYFRVYKKVQNQVWL